MRRFADEARVLCAYCSTWTPIRDLPVSTDARCWDCFLNDYEPPRLPLWRVSAWT